MEEIFQFKTEEAKHTFEYIENRISYAYRELMDLRDFLKEDEYSQSMINVDEPF